MRPPAGDLDTRPVDVDARPAATAILLRPAAAGLEVLLTQRPASMRFGGGMYVFPGGRLEPGESAADAAARETLEETGIRVAPEDLVALTRWVTPYGFPVRFDTRFFGVVVPPGTDVAEPSDEIASWRWLRPAAALEGVAAGGLAMWQPTFVTLQQLEGALDGADLLAAVADGTGAAPAEVSVGGSDGRLGRQFETTWAGGIEGRRAVATVVGTRRWVVVDPADPTTDTIDAVRAAAAADGATLVGALITGIDPARHAGVEMFARSLGLPIAAPPGAAGRVPYPVAELADGAAVPWTDAPQAVEVERPASGDAAVRWADRAARLRLSGPGGRAAAARPATGPSRRTSGGGR